MSEDQLPPEPTPGERLLYALGQLHRLRRQRGLGKSTLLSVGDVARVVGVANDVEFVSEEGSSTHFHFATEVLVVERGRPFPWRLLSTWEWAAEQELDELLRDLP